MAWVTPITDRAIADIVARNSKAFFNVADFERIHDNSIEIQDQILDLLGLDVDIFTAPDPLITMFATAAEINALVGAIEDLREGACLPEGTGIVPLKDDYQPGNGAQAPDYVAVNAWENNQNLLHTLIPYAADYVVSCGVANAGQERFYQYRWR